MRLGTRAATAVVTFGLAVVVALGAVPDPAEARDRDVPRATLATFAGHWWGHTRGLDITRAGYGSERVSDGCCYRVIDLSFRLSRPRGTPRDAVITLRVTGVRLYNKALYWKNRPLPRIGQRATLRLRNGVLTESVTGTIFCAPQVTACGA